VCTTMPSFQATFTLLSCSLNILKILFIELMGLGTWRKRHGFCS
jgi:hypothetical protein